MTTVPGTSSERPTPLLRRPGLETVTAVEGHLRAALSEFKASPERNDWPKPVQMAVALSLEDDIETVVRHLGRLRRDMERGDGDGDHEVSVGEGLPPALQEFIRGFEAMGKGRIERVVEIKVNRDDHQDTSASTPDGYESD